MGLGGVPQTTPRGHPASLNHRETLRTSIGPLHRWAAYQHAAGLLTKTKDGTSVLITDVSVGSALPTGMGTLAEVGY